MRHSFLRSLAISLLTLALFGNAVWAGDQMNVDFLIRQAVHKSARLKKWDANVQDELYGPSLTNHLPAVLDIVSEGIFGASFGIQRFKPDLATGLTAMSVGIASTLLSEVQEARSNKRVRQLFAQIAQYNLRVAQTVQALYPSFKSGDPEARAKLVEMTSEETVAEIQTNLQMEAFYQAAAQNAGLVKAAPRQPAAEQSVIPNLPAPSLGISPQTTAPAAE